MAKEKSKAPNWPSKQEGKKSGGRRDNAEGKPKPGNTPPKSGEKGTG